MCRPKKEGGLGIRSNLEIWNIGAVGKRAWHISNLQESFCIRWVHGVYTKGANWAIFNPPPTASWAVRKLCGVRNRLSSFMNIHTYNILAVYEERMEKLRPVHWDKWVLHRSSIPKERFIAWMTMLGKLPIKSRLIVYGLVDNDLCPLC